PSRHVLGGVILAGGAGDLAWQVGTYVSHSPPHGIDLASAGLIGHGVALALFFTRSGTFPVYAALCVVVLIAGLVWRSWLLAAVTSVLALIAAWRVSDVFKDIFARPRMAHWVGIHEPSYSYPSGHATLSLTFYGLWLYFIARSSLPIAVRRSLIGLMIFWIIAIGWSRLALGAHYPSDLIGGYFLGIGFISLALTVYTWIRNLQAGRVRA
ncbi:MAG TPA: phosphatase PAP2 family protein, partial [Candidatus Baltobacteraceae bacterium]